ncbi:hypothetical protein J4459_00375 [Candidatus Woesearchaeota archaeon]|nr:hypothetical protein [Candidatus Woesearchaeota archaeon]
MENVIKTLIRYDQFSASLLVGVRVSPRELELVRSDSNAELINLYIQRAKDSGRMRDGSS